MNSPESLGSTLAALGGARVVVVGDAMLDRYVVGEVERISPEAPIPVLRVREERAVPGGAGNVLRNLAALGAEAALVAVVGPDPEGGALARLLGAEAPGAECILLPADGRPTTVKTRYLAGGQQLLRSDREDGRPLSEAAERDLVEASEAVMEGAGALVLSDYGKGVLGAEVCRRLVEAAKARGIPTVVDPKVRDFARYAGASVVTPNRKELLEASGRPVGSREAVEAACHDLIERHGLGAVLATLSQEGMLYVPAEGPALHQPAARREVFDVSGAGDTVVAAIAAALAGGRSVPAALALATAAAGIVVGKVGTAVATAVEVAALDGSAGAVPGPGGTPVLDRPALIEQAARWRGEGLSVGFTNGCFDLLHPGHLSLLRQARAACDRLIVALNDDESVRRLKGPSRPVQDQASRAALLAAFPEVDAVALFHEDTPAELIAAVQPDVLVKGADYRPEEVVGADLVTARGGRVVLATLEPDHSTSRLVRRMAEPSEI